MNEIRYNLMILFDLPALWHDQAVDRQISHEGYVLGRFLINCLFVRDWRLTEKCAASVLPYLYYAHSGETTATLDRQLLRLWIVESEAMVYC